MKPETAQREIWRLVREDLLQKKEVKAWDDYQKLLPKESGTVLSTADGIAVVSGIHHAMYGEVIRFSGGQYGIAMNLEKETTGVVLISGERLKSGDDCFSTGTTVRMPTGDAVIGRVLTPLGRVLDGGPELPPDV
ncbi:MAG: hypothetical protein M0P44_06265, partial [Clostridiales bacterium]|nr:hypothetical protein [Clostridiales bacterium]